MLVYDTQKYHFIKNAMLSRLGEYTKSNLQIDCGFSVIYCQK